MFNKDSTKGTLIVVVTLSLLCSIIVSGAAVLLKPKQEEQKALFKQKNVLKVAGLLTEEDNIQQIFNDKVLTRYIDLDQGKMIEQQNYDQNLALKDNKQSIALKSSEDLAKIHRRTNVVESYLICGQNKQFEQIILPIYGSGLWSVMYGFVSIGPDGNTIKGVTYYDHGETPGLGGEIENPRWQRQFIDKKLLNEQQKMSIKIAKNAAVDKEHGIDSLSGASLTSKGVQNTFNFWFGHKGFEPFLQNVQAGRIDCE